MLVGAPPNWAEIVTAVGSALTGGTLLVGVGTAWFAPKQLGEARSDRHFQWVAEQSRRWDDQRLEDARVALAKFSSEQLAERVDAWLGHKGTPALDREMLVLAKALTEHASTPARRRGWRRTTVPAISWRRKF